MKVTNEQPERGCRHYRNRNNRYQITLHLRHHTRFGWGVRRTALPTPISYNAAHEIPAKV